MSTLSNQIAPLSSWKEQVNQRVAAHKDRKLVVVAAPDANGTSRTNTSARAAAAAARVAARYAQAPSYSELLAGEARAAVRAAEAASRAAQEAQAAAESVLAGIEASAAAESAWDLDANADAAGETAFSQTFVEAETTVTEPARVDTPVQPARWASEIEEFEARFEQDLPARTVETADWSVAPAAEASLPVAASVPEPVWTAPARLESDEIEMVEPAQPIHANLIEFPREIVATRKVRPRLAEGPLASAEDQLSIFEVDPNTISTEPAADAADTAAAPGWAAPEWSGIELDATPAREFYEDTAAEQAQAPERALIADTLPRSSPRRKTATAAPMQLRVMAAVVDGSLMVSALLGAAVLASLSLHEVLPLRTAETMAGFGLALVWAFYHVLFYALGDATPGMLYAGIVPCAAEGRRATRGQRIGRLAAMALSLAPMGLGVAWALFDEDHLGWHDRLSGTYLRAR